MKTNYSNLSNLASHYTHINISVPANVAKLEYSAHIVRGYFDCSGSDITSLKGSPRYVGAAYNCSSTNIQSLEGAPEYIGGSFICQVTEVNSLHYVHKYIKYIAAGLFLPATVKSHVLGVMFIGGLREIIFSDINADQKQVALIINKHLAGDRNVHECQEELIEAGLKEYARL